MKSLGLNPGEQEMIDMTNEVNVNGLIYYPDFCKLVLRKYREENREVLNQALFKVGNILHLIRPELDKHFRLFATKGVNECTIFISQIYLLDLLLNRRILIDISH